MELRKRVRRPVRYQDENIPGLPDRCSPVPEVVPQAACYNDKLPKAAFPTLDEPAPPTTEPSPGELEPNEPKRQAIVFRDPRSRLQKSTREKNFHVSKSSGKHEDLENPGEFMSYGYFSEDEHGNKKPRAQIGAFRRLEWQDLSDGIQIAIFFALMQDRSFESAVNLIGLTQDQTKDIKKLLTRETELERIEQEKIDRCLSQQLSVLMSGATKAGGQAYNSIFEEELSDNIQDSSTLSISKMDVLRARHFLRMSSSEELIELAEHMWDYYGVRSSPLDFSGILDEEVQVKPPQTQCVESNEANNFELEAQTGDKRKRETFLANVTPKKGTVESIKPKRSYTRRKPLPVQSPEKNKLPRSNLQHSPPPDTPDPSARRRGRPRKNECFSDGTEVTAGHGLTNMSPNPPKAIVNDQDSSPAARKLFTTTTSAGRNITVPNIIFPGNNVNQPFQKVNPAAMLGNANQKRNALREYLRTGSQVCGEVDSGDCPMGYD